MKHNEAKSEEQRAKSPFVIQIQGEALGGQYLKGPRTPADVRRLGYGFTEDVANAWPFPTQGLAMGKLRVLARHMAWPLSKLAVVPMESGVAA